MSETRDLREFQNVPKAVSVRVKGVVVEDFIAKLSENCFFVVKNSYRIIDVVVCISEIENDYKKLAFGLFLFGHRHIAFMEDLVNSSNQTLKATMEDHPFDNYHG